MPPGLSAPSHGGSAEEDIRAPFKLWGYTFKSMRECQMRTLLMLKEVKQRIAIEPEARHAPSDWDASRGCRTITVWDFAF